MAVLSTISERNILGWARNALRADIPMAHIDAACGPIQTTDQLQETFVSVGSAPLVTEMIGPRKVSPVTASTWTVDLKQYDVGLVLGERERALDKTGQVQQRVNDLAIRWARFWDQMFVTKLKLGESTACYDGQFFFDTDHSEGASGSQSNDLTSDISTTTAPTPEEAEISIWQAVTATMNFKDDKGYPMHQGTTDFTILIPLPFMRSFKAALGVQLLPGLAGAQNVLATAGGFNFNLVAHPLLSSAIGGTAWTTKWALIANDGRAMVRLSQRGLDNIVEMLGEDSDFYFTNQQIMVSYRGYRELHYMDWKSAVLTTFT